MVSSVRTISLTLFIIGALGFSLSTLSTGLSLCRSVASCASAATLYKVNFGLPTSINTPTAETTNQQAPASTPAARDWALDDQVAPGEVIWITSLYLVAVATIALLWVEALDPTLFGRHRHVRARRA